MGGKIEMKRFLKGSVLPVPAGFIEERRRKIRENRRRSQCWIKMCQHRCMNNPKI